MGIIKEAKNIDMSNKSEPWTERELIDFRKIMENIKAKNQRKKERIKKQTIDKKHVV